MNPRQHPPHQRQHNCAECGFPATPNSDRIHLPKHYCWKCAEYLSERQHPPLKAKKKETR